MNRFFFILFLFWFGLACAFSQTNEWTWMHGSNALGQSPVTGTQGVPAPANTPGANYEGAEWTDNNGNFWLLTWFGDFWKYDPITNMWTWIYSGWPATYGTQGVPSATTFPGGRGYGPITWTDLNNNLWLYSGYQWTPTRTTIDPNLWKYDIATGQWTWMKGPGACNFSQPVYGTKGTGAVTNNPGSRDESTCSWIDAAGDLWFYGGNGSNGNCAFGGGHSGAHSDLWKYDIATNNWVWMSGSTALSILPVYGTKGVPATTNTPGGRAVYASGKDLQGNFLLFGGLDSVILISKTTRNDLWRYNYINDQWTWLSGSNLANQPGVYVTKCVPSSTINPGSGFEVRSRWSDDCGNLWLFGTDGYSNGTTSFMFTNSLWRYSLANDTWTWVSGTGTLNQNGVYGTRGVSAPTNTPGSRQGANSWRYKNDLYLFGGYGYAATGSHGQLNDLWKYSPDKPTALYTYSLSSNCVPSIITFTDSSTPGCNEIKSYLWDFGDPSSGVNNTSTAVNPTHTYTASGTYNIKLLVTNCTGSKDSLTNSITIGGSATSFSLNICSGQSALIHGVSRNVSGVYSQTFTSGGGCDSVSTVNLTVIPSPTLTVSPILDTIESGNSIIIIANGATAYSWSEGSISSSITVSPTQNTTYCVVGTNSVICSDTVCSDIIVVNTTCDGVKIVVPTGFSPNGDGQNDVLKLFATGKVESLHFAIYNRWGQTVFETSDITKTWDGNFNNQPMDMAVFTYTLRYSCKSDNKEELVSGNVSLVR